MGGDREEDKGQVDKQRLWFSKKYISEKKLEGERSGKD